MLIPHPLYGVRPESIPVFPWDFTCSLMEFPRMREKVGTLDDFIRLEGVLAKNRLEEWPKILPAEQLAHSLSLLHYNLEDCIIHGNSTARTVLRPYYEQVSQMLGMAPLKQGTPRSSRAAEPSRQPQRSPTPASAPTTQAKSAPAAKTQNPGTESRPMTIGQALTVGVVGMFALPFIILTIACIIPGDNLGDITWAAVLGFLPGPALYLLSRLV